VIEGAEGKTGLTGWKVLIFFCASTLLVPMAILLICAAFISWHQYPLPTIFLAAYVLAGIASPIMGVIGLITLLARSRTLGGKASPVERKVRGYLLILSIMNVFAIGLWFMFFPYVIFSIGGTR
jgi:hypothetical protein